MARGDTCYVANYGINTITKYDDTAPNCLSRTRSSSCRIGLALDASGNLYVSTSANTIEKFAPADIDLGVFASTGLNFAMALAFDSTGNLYAANFGGTTIEKFGPNGADLGVFAYVTRLQPALPSTARAIFTWQILGPRFSRFAPNGTPLGAFATTGLNNPEGIAFDSSGNLYAANNGSNTIEVFSSERGRSRPARHDRIERPVRPRFRHRRESLRGQQLTATIEKIAP